MNANASPHAMARHSGVSAPAVHAPAVKPAILPLLAARDLDAPLAWHRGQPVSGHQFLADAEQLAEQLPAHGRPLNLCQDRYAFALALAAALLRGQTSLMPPNALPETLANIAAGDGAPLYALMDLMPPGGLGGLPAIQVAAARIAPVDAALAHAVSAAASARPLPHIDAALDAVCLLTSGSTGAPQPYGKRWGALVANIAAEAERLAQLLGRASLAGVSVLATVPAQHSYGFESTVLLALLGGASFDTGRPFYPADIAAALARLPQPRALVTTPFHLKTLLLAGVPLPAVDLVLSATAPLSPQLAALAESRFGGTLVEIYGCTEAGQVATRRTTQGETWHTLGALRVWREDSADGSAGSEGGHRERFLVHGGHVLEPTPLADLLVLEDAHHFRLLGRANDLIHVAGKRSSLGHLNFHLNRIPGVDDGAFWMPDDVADGIVRPLVFVVAPTLAAADIVQALRDHVEPAFVPRRVIHVTALPREATGKLTAQALQHFALQTLQTQAQTPARTQAQANEQAQAQAPLDAAAPAEAAAPDAQGTPTGPTSSATPTAPVLFDVATDHPAFAGHFPGQPLLPGVVLLSFVMQAVQQQPALQARLGPAPSIDNVKFLAPVGPGAQVAVTLAPKGSGVAFDLHHGATLVARGQLSAGAAA